MPRGEAHRIGHPIRPRQAALAWLATVNVITPAEALAYVQRAFQIHEIRSRFQWRLNIEMLTSHYGVKLDKRGLEQGFNLPT